MNHSICHRKRSCMAVATLTAVMLMAVLLKSGSGKSADANPASAPGPSAATNPPPQRLSLAQAKEIAFEKNWDLLAAKSGIDAATAQLIVAEEFPNPTASLSSAYIGSYHNATVEGNSLWQRNYDTIFAVNQLIEIAGKRH